VANLIRKRLSRGASAGDTVVLPPFRYRDKGNLAVIGRNKAVAEIGPFKFWGVLAWFLWVFVHIGYLIEFDNKLLVLIQWAWNYFTRKRGARLVTGEDAFPLVKTQTAYQLPVVARAYVSDARPEV
jgi:NADH dehydrogenase